MHELTVTENVLEIALRNGKQAGAVKITDIYLVIGELSSIIDDSVCFYWDMISEETIAEGAALHFRRIPARFSCQQCNRKFGVQASYQCPECESSKISITAGKEFFVEAIEVDEKQPSTTAGDNKASEKVDEISPNGAAA